MAAIGVTFGFARYGYGLFLPAFRGDFKLSISLVGLIGSATYVGYLVALLAVGGLVARFGPRPLVVAGGVSATVGTGIVALASGPVPLIAGLVLAGMSPGWAWAPYSDAVDRLVPPERRDRVMGAIGTGTAFAVTVAGVLAFLAHWTGWRFVWLVFAAGSLLSTVLNARVLPSGPHRPAGCDEAADAGDGTDASMVPEQPMVPGQGRTRRRQRRVRARWFVRRAVLPLHFTAFLYGLVGAVYWSFAVSAVAGAGGSGSGSSGAGGSATVPLFWTLMGVAGTAGVLTGHAIGRYGLRRMHTWLFVGLAAAVGLLGAAPGSPFAVLTSAALYGPCFMAGSGMLAVWSYHLFSEQPSTGFSVTVFFLGLGTVTGPAVVGALAGSYGLRAALLATALLAVLSPVVRPRAGTTRLYAARTPADPVPGSDPQPETEPVPESEPEREPDAGPTPAAATEPLLMPEPEPGPDAAPERENASPAATPAP